MTSLTAISESIADVPRQHNGVDLYESELTFTGLRLAEPLLPSTVRFVGNPLVFYPALITFTGLRLAEPLLPSTVRFVGNRVLRSAIRPAGDLIRIYRSRVGIGELEMHANIVNWQGTFAADRSSYLALTVHNPSNDLLDGIISSMEEGIPVTITVETGWRYDSGNEYYSDLFSVKLTTVSNSIGTNSASVRLEGYGVNSPTNPKKVAISGTQMIRTGTFVQWRGVIDDRVHPGDLITIGDTTLPDFVAGAIVYTINATSAVMHVNELTDAETLSTLPW